MSNKEIKRPSLDGLEKAKKDFEDLYKRVPSDKIMEILTEEEISETEKTPAKDDIAAASRINETASAEKNMKETDQETGA